MPAVGWPVATPVLALATAALGLLIWPSPARRQALLSTGPVGSGQPGAVRARSVSRSAVALGIAVLTVGVTVALGVPAGLAAGTAGATTAVLVRGWGRESVERRDWVSLAAGLRMLARELRSGTPPADAAAAVASTLTGAAGAVFDDLAAAARLGVDRALPVRTGPAGAVAGQLRAGLGLALVQGVPWAVLVEATARDVDDRVDAVTLRASQVAGPRFSGYVLAALPIFGLLLGSGMGARPLAVLLGPAPGSLLLPAGVALECAGLLWSARIVRC